MLKTDLLHPDILRVCARSGHHSKILIADGNYPASTKRGPQSELVCLQLVPGVPTVVQVLRAILSTVPVDLLNTMGIPSDDPYAKFGEPPAWAEYRDLAKQAGLGAVMPISKWDFYKAVESPDHVLTIQTADQALWANVLVTIGCRT
ncbi:MAG TPA: RbsD/FucU family protein [Verrucomicrobiae bacterium]|nr:RbsD/FucU family protein [Verrucomicrobiae bacterium]